MVSTQLQGNVVYDQRRFSHFDRAYHRARSGADDAFKLVVTEHLASEETFQALQAAFKKELVNKLIVGIQSVTKSNCPYWGDAEEAVVKKLRERYQESDQTEVNFAWSSYDGCLKYLSGLPNCKALTIKAHLRERNGAESPGLQPVMVPRVLWEAVFELFFNAEEQTLFLAYLVCGELLDKAAWLKRLKADLAPFGHSANATLSAIAKA